MSKKPHPGFDKVSSGIAKNASRNASKGAKKANPNLKNVPTAKKGK